MSISISSTFRHALRLRRVAPTFGLFGAAVLAAACSAETGPPSPDLGSPPAATAGPGGTAGAATSASADDNSPSLPVERRVKIPMRNAKGNVKTVNAEVRRGRAYFQGDMDLGDPDDVVTVRGAALSDKDKRWPNAVVPYFFDAEISNPQERQKVVRAMRHIELNTPIRFVETDSGPFQSNRLVVERSDDPSASSAPVGFQGSTQPLRLHAGAGENTVIHELCHALGLRHEQARPDRNSFVTIHWNNIEDGREDNFDMEDDDDILDEWFPYDMDSIMHYRRTQFCRRLPNDSCVGPTITDNPDTGRTFGSSVLTDRDINTLTAMYGKPLGTDEQDDRFGTAMTIADFDGDGRKDIVVGAPREKIGSGPRSGAVYFFKGTGPDVMPLEYLSEETPNGNGNTVASNEADDELGFAMTSADFDQDGFMDLAVGAPNKAPGAGPRSGGVMLYRGTSSGLEAWFFLSLSDLGKSPQAGDRFGAALATVTGTGSTRPALVVGAPGRSTGGAVYVVSMNVIIAGSSRPSEALTAQTPVANGALGSSLAVGDFDGDGKPDIAAGAPGNGTLGGGAVSIFRGNGSRALDKWTTLGSPGTTWSGDQFGFSIAAANIVTTNAGGRSELVVGAPGKRKPGTSVSTGGAFVYEHHSSNIPYASWWSKNQDIYPGSDTDAQGFGHSMSAGDILGSGTDEVAIGAPRWSSFQGRVVVMKASGGTLTPERTLTGESFGQPQFGSSVLAGSVSVTYPYMLDPSESGNPTLFVGSPFGSRFPVLTSSGAGIVAGFTDSLSASILRTRLYQEKRSVFMSNAD